MGRWRLILLTAAGAAAVVLAGAAMVSADGVAAATKLPAKPRIVWDPVPFGPTRKAQMVAYVRRHYGSFMKPTWRLIDPHVIVIHYTDASYGSTFNTFANDVPDSELHELPADCAHFVIDTDGMIHQLVSLGTMCRHTVSASSTSASAMARFSATPASCHRACGSCTGCNAGSISRPRM
jgi:hypothetical protein